DVSDRKLRRPREGGEPVARSSERRWVPASAGTTELCKQAGATDMKKRLCRPREGGDPVARSSERRWVPASAGTTQLCKQAGATDMKKSFVVPAKAGTRWRVRAKDAGFPLPRERRSFANRRAPLT